MRKTDGSPWSARQKSQAGAESMKPPGETVKWWINTKEQNSRIRSREDPKQNVSKLVFPELWASSQAWHDVMSPEAVASCGPSAFYFFLVSRYTNTWRANIPQPQGEQREEVFLSLQAQSDNLGLTHDTWFKLSFHLATQMCRAEGGKMATREKTNSNQCRSHFSFRCRSFFFFFFHMQLPTHQFIFGNETASGKTPDAVISWVIFFWQSSHTDESATHRRVWLITKHTMELQGEVITL